MGYSTEGTIGYRVFVPDLKEVIVGVHCTFNEIIPSYSDEYFNEIKKLTFELAPDESTVESFTHLVGQSYLDDETRMEYITTRVSTYKGLIVAYRSPVLTSGRVGVEEKSPIHVADVVRMMSETNLGSTESVIQNLGSTESGSGRTRTANLGSTKSGRTSGDQARGSDMSESGRANSIQPQRDTFANRQFEVTGQVVSPGRVVTVISDLVPNLTDPKRVRADGVSRLVGTHGRTVERTAQYDRHSKPELDVISPSDQHDTEIFVNHKWTPRTTEKDQPTKQDKRNQTARVLSNVSSLGNVFVAQEADHTGQSLGTSGVLQSRKRPSTDGSGRVSGVPSTSARTSDERVPDEIAPDTFKQAVEDKRWRDSMSAEIKALRNRGCWRVIRTPQGVKLIKSRYVYRLKKDWTGKVTKRKSRLVVQGFSQVEGVDYTETFAPVAKVATFRLMLALTKVLNLHIHQLDVDSAFLYADLQENVFMKPPPGMDMPKNLYGLKQAPRNRNKNIVDYIKSIGFKQCILDNCLFVKCVGDEIYLISLYVDDILIAGTKLVEIEKIKQEFTMRYEMKDLGELQFYLGMKITRTKECITVDQERYTLDTLQKYEYLLRGLENKNYNTPMERDLKLRKFEADSMTPKQEDYVSRFPYQNIVGALLYLSINTRPDISYPVGVLARFSKAPTFRACKALLRVLIYLRGTAQRGIKFSGDDLNLSGYSDADWAGDLDSRRSTTGYVIYAAGGPIAWQSKLQTTIAVSTMEAEYMAAFGAIQELIWTKGVLSEMKFDYVDPMILLMDSKSAMALAKNPTHHKRSKHIDIKYHWLREHTCENGTVLLEHCGTEDMVADVMTKALAFEFHMVMAKFKREVSGVLAPTLASRHQHIYKIVVGRYESGIQVNNQS